MAHVPTQTGTYAFAGRLGVPNRRRSQNFTVAILKNLHVG